MTIIVSARLLDNNVSKMRIFGIIPVSFIFLIAIFLSGCITIPKKNYYSCKSTEIKNRDRIRVCSLAIKNAELDKTQLVNAYILRAFSYAKLKQSDLASKDIDTVLDIQPNHHNALSMKAMLLRDNKKIEQSTEIFRNLMNLDPDTELWPYNISVNYLAKGDLKSSLKFYNKARRINSENFNISIFYAEKLAKYGYKANALKMIDEFSINFSEHERQIDLLKTHVLTTMGRFDDAISVYDSLIKKNSRDAAVYFFRGRVHYKNGKIDEAMQDFETSLSISPHAPQVLAARGWARINTGDLDLAVKDFRKALNLSRDLYETMAGLAWLHATAPDAELRDKVLAVSSGETAVSFAAEQSDHELPMAISLNALAAALANAGRFVEASQKQEEALQWLERTELKNLKTDEYQKRLELYRHNLPYRLKF